MQQQPHQLNVCCHWFWYHLLVTKKNEKDSVSDSYQKLLSARLLYRFNLFYNYSSTILNMSQYTQIELKLFCMPTLFMAIFYEVRFNVVIMSILHKVAILHAIV